MREYDKRDIQDGQRRLRLLNNWAYACILTGRSLGLEEQLQDLRVALEGTLPTLAANFRSTLVALELSRGNAAEAVVLARANMDRVQRRQQGRFALELVRTLVESGDLPGAMREGRAAAELTRQDGEYFRGLGQVAHGLALALTQPAAAVPLLWEAMAFTALAAETRCMAALYWMRAAGEGPEALPTDVRVLFNDLTEAGLRTLSGPEAEFHRVWRGLLGADTRLELRFFGKAEARMDGTPVRLTRTGAEILLMLSEHPGGLTEEQLHARLFEDGQGVEPVTLRVRVSRLRERVPVTDSPYRLGLEHDSDLSRLRRRLDEGDVQGAVEVYRGPLLPGLRSWLGPIIADATHTRAGIGAAVGLIAGDERIVLDFPLGEVRPWRDGEEPAFWFRFPRELVATALRDRLPDWVNTLLLSCRFEAHRDGPYNEFVYTFFKSLSTERMAYCERFYTETAGAGNRPLEWVEVDGWTVEKRCPHQGAHLDRVGTVEGTTITCGLHGWAFDLETGACLNSEGEGTALRVRGRTDRLSEFVQD